MKNIESYNAAFPSAYYKVGTIYSFYGKKFTNGSPATKTVIRKYASVLEKLIVEQEESAIKPVKGAVTFNGNMGLERFYAVVVDKTKSGKNAYITVMFCNKLDGKVEYYTKKYSVGQGCKTDKKELMPASTYLGFESKKETKIGGVTLAAKSETIGGVTRANGKNITTPSVGGITKVHSSNSQNPSSSSSVAKVGGVTLVRKQKVGGITRTKK